MNLAFLTHGALVKIHCMGLAPSSADTSRKRLGSECVSKEQGIVYCKVLNIIETTTCSSLLQQPIQQHSHLPYPPSLIPPCLQPLLNHAHAFSPQRWHDNMRRRLHPSLLAPKCRNQAQRVVEAHAAGSPRSGVPEEGVFRLDPIDAQP